MLVTTILLAIIAVLGFSLNYHNDSKIRARDALRALWPDLTPTQRRTVSIQLGDDMDVMELDGHA